MPVFASVSASDPVETVRWFTEVLDFGVVFTGRGRVDPDELAGMMQSTADS